MIVSHAPRVPKVSDIRMSSSFFHLVLSIGLLFYSISPLSGEERSSEDTDVDAGEPILSAKDSSVSSPSLAYSPVESDGDETFDCPNDFRTRCLCGRLPSSSESKYRGSYVTNCTSSNFTSTSMLTAMPESTEILIFTGNSLVTELPSNLFGKHGQRNYDKLHVIDMSNNQISSIKGKSFHNVRNVKKLILDNNKLLITGEHFHPRIFSNFESLEELHLRNAFAETHRGLNFMEDLVTTLNEGNLTKLKVLNIENNGIQMIPNPFVMCSLPSLSKLYLGGNALTDAKINVSCTPKLFLLDISDNFISTLDNFSLTMFPNTPKFHVNLTRNPMKCDCKLLDMYRWIKTTQTWVLGNKTLMCASGYPESNAGRLVNDLEERDFLCSTLDDEDLQGYVTASFAILISLILALIVLLAALLFTHRDQVVKVWDLLSNSVANKAEYTSLNQEQHHKRVHSVNMHHHHPHRPPGVEEISV